MKSRITIDVDYENQPIIKIEYLESEDVRDKLVKRFLESFGYDSIYCTHNFINYVEINSNKKESWIKPVRPDSELFIRLDKNNTSKTVEEIKND